MTLTLDSPDGDAGFPGNLTATCVYRLLEPATLRVELTARCDKPTIVNLTQHAYFNLDGSPDVLDHELHAGCDFYTPSDAELIPTGEIRSVAGTPFDFRQPRTIRNRCGADLRHQFRRRARARRRRARAVATLRSPKNGLSWNCTAPSPACRSMTPPSSIARRPGLDGARYGAHAGAVPGAAGVPGFAQPAPFHRLRASPGERIPPRRANSASR